MARMTLGWVCFLPASAALPVGDIGGALLFGKGLQQFWMRYQRNGFLFTASTNAGDYGSGKIRGSLNTSPVLSDFGR